MSTFTVLVPGGAVEPFVDIDPTSTVGEFKAVVGARVGMKSFRLYVKTTTEGTKHLTRSDDGTLLNEVGSVDFQLKKQGQGWAPAKLAQWRLDRGVTQVAKSLSSGFKEVGGKVDAVAADLKVAVGILRGEAGPRPEGMSASARMEQNRVTVLVCQTENRELKKEIAATTEEKKIARSHAVTEAAQVAEGSVDVAVGGIVGENLEEKFEAHKAQGRILAVARRKEKAQERKAAAKAKVVAKPKGRKRCRAEADGQDPDQSIEKELEALLDAGDAVAQVAAASSSSSDAPALGA